MSLPEPEYYLLAQDIVWQLMSRPEAKYDQANIEAACDIGFIVSRIFFARRDEERLRLEAIERDLLKAEVASQKRKTCPVDKSTGPKGPHQLGQRHQKQSAQRPSEA
jgi:hypothetical protein